MIRDMFVPFDQIIQLIDSVTKGPIRLSIVFFEKISIVMSLVSDE